MINRSIEMVDFSSSDDEEADLLVPTPDMLSQYNREYSIIVREVQKFLKETTECIQRFVAFHNFGANLNLQQLLGNLTQVETSFRGRLAETGKDPKTAAKQKYETTFNRLIHRMTDLFRDLLDCELQFKKTYFGIQTHDQSFRQQERIRTSRSPIAYSVSSMTKSSTSGKLKLPDYIQNQQKQEKRQAELRATLNEKLKPQAPPLNRQCKDQYSTTENLYRLNQKVDQFITDIKATRARQEKLIELFHLNRVKKIHTPEVTQCMTPCELSAIEGKSEEEAEEQMDTFLENWRKVRKDSDSYTEKGVQPRTFMKKRSRLQQNRI